MKRFLSVLLICLALCAACAMGVSAAAFDPGSVQRCIFLNDTTTANGFGHCGMVLVDKDGNGLLYSFQTGGLWQMTLSPGQLKQFKKDGLIPNALSQFQFDRAIEFDVLPAEGRRMYDYAATHEFREFYMYASFFTSFLPIGDNCLSFVYSTMTAGSPKYSFLYPFGVPVFVFYTLQLNLRLNAVPYTVYYPG